MNRAASLPAPTAKPIISVAPLGEVRSADDAKSFASEHSNFCQLLGVTVSVEGALRIGALADDAEVFTHPEVQRRYPLLAQAFRARVSRPGDNMDGVGEIQLQQARGSSLYDALARISVSHQLSGDPLSVTEESRAGAECLSHVLVALAALNAVVNVEGKKGVRALKLGDLNPWGRTSTVPLIEEGDLILSVEIPAQSISTHAAYVTSGNDMGEVSAAVSFCLQNRRLENFQIAIGLAGEAPWHVTAITNVVEGRQADNELPDMISTRVVQLAEGQPWDDHLRPLLRSTLTRALSAALEGARV